MAAAVYAGLYASTLMMMKPVAGREGYCGSRLRVRTVFAVHLNYCLKWERERERPWRRPLRRVSDHASGWMTMVPLRDLEGYN